MPWDYKRAIKDWWNDLLGRKDYRRYQEKETRWQRIGSQILWVLSVICALFYIGWCMANANWRLWFAFVPFIIAEIACFFLMVLWGVMVWIKRRHRPDGIEPKTRLSVDVFVCVCREPLDIVAPTIAAAARLDYDNKKVYILDDGDDPDVKALADKHGCQYFGRPTHEFAKAGNLNYGFRRSSGDLILALDADQVAEPEMIKHIIGYFELKHIGFVQTNQRFNVPPDDPWGNSDVVFYKAMQSGKDNANAAISCGSGVMYRRAAIESIGGFSEWDVVEDLHTSLRLHDKGWTSVYHDTSYTFGSAPQDIISHTKQRWQWAVDSMRMIFHDNPFKHKGLNFFQKVQYFHFGYHYVVYGLFLPVFFILPIFTLFSHQFILLAPITVFLLVRLPYYVTQTLNDKVLTGWTYSFKAFQAQAGLFAIFFNAIVVAALHPSTVPKYTVTSKKVHEVSLKNRLRLTWLHLLLVAASLAAMMYGVLTVQKDFWFLAINIFWGMWTILTLSRFIILGWFPGLYYRSQTSA